MNSSTKDITKLIGEVTGIPEERIQEDSKLIEDLNLSSLQIMVIFSEMEGRFNAGISEEQLLSVRTVGDLAAIIKSK